MQAIVSNPHRPKLTRTERRERAIESAQAKLANGQAWTVEEAAAMLSCHPQTVRKMCRRVRNPLPHFMVGREPRFWSQAVKNWKEQSEN